MTLIQANANLLQRNFLYKSSPVALSSGQMGLDALQENFVAHASDWRSLTSMVVAGGLGKALLCVRPSFANLMGNSGARLFSQGVSLLGESFAFETMQRTLNPNHVTGNFFENCQSHLINFGVLRVSGFMGARSNSSLQLGLESTAMVVGQNIAASPEISQKSLSEQWIDASVFALQNRASFAALHALSAGRLRFWEQGLELRRQISFHPPHHAERTAYASMASSGERDAKKAAHRAHLEALMAREDHGRYFRVMPQVVDVHHTEADLEAWIGIRQRIAARRNQEATHSNPIKSSLVGVSILIRDADGRILLSHDRESERRVPRIPSESVELEDISIAEVALRGVQEELGTSAEWVANVARVSVQFYINGVAQNLRHYHLVEVRLNGPIRLPANGEIKEVEFVEPGSNLHFSPEGMYEGLNRVMSDIVRAYLASLPSP